MIEQTPRTVRRVGKVISEPEPQFVSLVNHGANQTPFKVVKSEIEMTKQKQAEAGDNPALQRIELSKTQFATEESAIEYLAKHGYEGTLDSEDEKWVALAKAETDFDSLDTIDSGEEGVTRYVGVLKQDTESDDGEVLETKTDDATEEPEPDATTGVTEGETADADSETGETTKGAETDTDLKSEILTKYDRWDATYSNETSIAGVLDDGQWNEPFPGFLDLCHAMSIALRNKLAAGDSAGASEVLSEFNGLATSIIGAYSKLQKGDEPGELLKQLLFVPDTEGKEEIKKEDTPQAKTVIIKYERDETLHEKVEGLASAVETLTKANETLTEENGKVRKELDLLVKTPGGSNQLDGDNIEPAETQKTASNEVADIAMAGAFGVQRHSL